MPDKASRPTANESDEPTSEDVLSAREAFWNQREAAEDERQRIAGIHDLNAEGRDRRATDKENIAVSRDDLALSRDQNASRRDSDAAVRDADAVFRDQRAAQIEPASTVSPAAKDRRGAASDRSSAAADRHHARADRAEAEADRAASVADRQTAAAQFASDQIDTSTGALLRGPGMVQLAREIQVARDASLDLVMGFVDVVGLKIVNDTVGHRAGDDVLVDVVAALRDGMRPGDAVVRYGGDEFICTISGVDLGGAQRRLFPVHALLAARNPPVFVTIGLSQLTPVDTVEDMASRADAELYRQRKEGYTGGVGE